MNGEAAWNDAQTLGQALSLQARVNPDKTFLMFGDAAYSFRQVNSRVNRYAMGLASLGLKAGDRLGIYLGSCLEFVLVTFAANKLGVVWVPINTDYKGKWLTDTLRDSKVRVLATEAERLSDFSSLEADPTLEAVLLRGEKCNQYSKHLKTIPLNSFEDLDDSEPDPGLASSSDIACILWTSGTTGMPKGVMQSHNVWLLAVRNSVRAMGIREDDVGYNCLPLYNSAAWVSGIYRALLAGLPCGIDPEFSASRFWQRISHYHATMTTTLGAMHMYLWNAQEGAGDADNTLRVASMIPMPEELIEPFSRRFGLQAIFQGFGQSECLSLMLRDNRPGKTWKMGSLGDVIGPVDIALLDDHDNPVAVGETGELCLRPKVPCAMFSGYFDNDSATLAAQQNLWYHSGDLLRMDEDGEYFFVDRKADYIRHKGRNISSAQVEEVIRGYPGVEAVAVVGVESPDLPSESEIKVVVVLQRGQQPAPEQLARYINDNAPYFMVPRYIEYVEKLPYTPTNKVQKYLLRQAGQGSRSWDRDKTQFKVER